MHKWFAAKATAYAGATANGCLRLLKTVMSSRVPPSALSERGHVLDHQVARLAPIDDAPRPGGQMPERLELDELAFVPLQHLAELGFVEQVVSAGYHRPCSIMPLIEAHGGGAFPGRAGWPCHVSGPA